MMHLRSLYVLVLGSALLSSCATRSSSSQISDATEKEFFSEDQKYLSEEEMDDSFSEEPTRTPRPQVVQLPSKS